MKGCFCIFMLLLAGSIVGAYIMIDAKVEDLRSDMKLKETVQTQEIEELKKDIRILKTDTYILQIQIVTCKVKEVADAIIQNTGSNRN